MSSDLEIMKKLLSVATSSDDKGSLKNLRQAFQQTVFNTSAEKQRAKEMLAYAHLACFNLDGRILIYAIKYFFELKNWAQLQKILELAKTYGHLRAVWTISLLGQRIGNTDLQMKNFASWFKETGIKWFDLYCDQKKGLAFIKPKDQKLLTQIINKFYHWSEFWAEVLQSVNQDSKIDPERKALLKKLSEKKKPVVAMKILKRPPVEEKFRSYCARENIKILSCLQEGLAGIRRCSFVFLALDHDGIIKIFKENLNYHQGYLGGFCDNENDLYLHLQRTDLMPHCYGQVIVDEELSFIKRSICFQSPLVNYIAPVGQLDVDKICHLVRLTAKKLQQFHEHNMFYLDLKPEHLFVNPAEENIDFVDFGISRILRKEENKVPVFLADPRFGTPEIGQSYQVGFAAEVFQLGILFHLLLTGKHPFMMANELIDSDDCRESQIIKYFWPTIVLPYESEPIKKFKDERLSILPLMLNKDPQQRPTLKQVIERLDSFGADDPLPVFRQKKIVRKKEKNIVLFPARMGVPHKGHVEYISRLLDLGYYVVISLQRSFTITDRDPLPKWLVEKMIAQSLFDNGYNSNNFEFIFTPFYQTIAELKLHFIMWPDFSEVVAVASSNPDVSNLFKEHLILDQRAVFGQPGKEFYHQSWGEILRRAIKAGDRKKFLEYAGSGVEKIFTLFEIQKNYGQPAIEFVPGKVIVILLDESGAPVIQGGVFRYRSPEESLIRHLILQGKESRIINAYDKSTIISINNVSYKISYQKTVFDGTNETIIFHLA